MLRTLGLRLGLTGCLAGADPARRILQAARAAGAALLAAECPCCRQPMGWGRYGVCEPCWQEVAPLKEPACAICGGGVPREAGAGARCSACRTETAPFAAVTAYGDYAGRLREMIHALKYHGRSRLAVPLGRFAASGLTSAALADPGADPIVVPVPLSRDRLALRGYNQSGLIARSLLGALAAETGRRPMMIDALRKVVETPPQAGRSRRERLRSPEGAYAIANREAGRIAGRRVVLVDDVLTTGATARACSRVLSEAGATEILVAVVARTRAGRASQDGVSGSSDDVEVRG